MRHAVPGVEHYTRGAARGVQWQYSLNTDVEGRGVEGLK